MSNGLIPSKQQLSFDEVHLWWTLTNVSEQSRAILSNLLSLDEKRRASRFVFMQERHRFIVARGMLRTILAQYLDCRPEEIIFRYGMHGKPHISSEDGSRGIEFNLSHSHELVVYAVSYRRAVGIDIEYLHVMDDMEQIVSIAFSHVERVQLMKLAREHQLVGFFNCWTRKEAYVKSRGDGLLTPLHEFDVSLTPGRPAELLANRLDQQEVANWSLYSISPVTGYVGAVSVEGQDAQISIRHWCFI